MRAVVRMVITIEVTSEEQARKQVTLFAHLLNSYAEIDKVEIEKVEVLEDE